MAYALTTLPPNWGKAEFAGDMKVNVNSIVKELQAALVLAAAGPFMTVQAGKSAAGALTLTGAKVGDVVAGVANLTTPGDLKSSFEAVITVANQIQQSSATDLSAKQCQFTLIHQS